MGDRAVVMIKDERDNYLHVYAHWSGAAWATTGCAAALEARERWGDSGYATRIMLTSMIGGIEGSLGYGVSMIPCESEHPVPVFDVSKGEAWLISAGEYDSGSYDHHERRSLTIDSFVAVMTGETDHEPNEYLTGHRLR